LSELEAGIATVPRFPVEGIAARHKRIADQIARNIEIKRANLSEPARKAAKSMLSKEARRVLAADTRARIAQPVVSPNGFHERLAAFWTNHFSVSAEKNENLALLAPLHEAEAIRPFIAGPFATLLRNAVLHPAMLYYLDQVQSVGPGTAAGKKTNRGLNENLARELLELHTVGAGSGYDQADVRATANLLTGMTVDTEAATARFRADIAEPGSRQVLGKTYGAALRSAADITQLLDDLAGNSRTATHVCRKLATHFIADTPPRGVVDDMVAAWKASDGRLAEVYRAMLESDAARRTAGDKARQPFDYVVASLRALGAFPAEGKTAAFVDWTPTGAPVVASPEPRRRGRPELGVVVPVTLKRMGQPTWKPPTPAGFEESFATWITPIQISRRLDWTRRVLAEFGQGLDPEAVMHAALGDMARADTVRLVSQAPSRMSALVLILMSPEFNRR
jgi:uncharacterized protein (DUF1800 family)